MHVLEFLDREGEVDRLRDFCAGSGGLAVVYGRRRCGKSRLLLESLPAERTAYYLADEREAALQRASVAAELARRMPGFDQVVYPDWEALFSRYFRECPPGSVLAIDEFPALVASARELPSVLQRHLDGRPQALLVLCGSSQRLMHGLVLDRAAPLFGRADEILKVRPLPAGWLGTALGTAGEAAIEAYSVWGGVPRYWELARRHPTLQAALRALVLDPLGVLHEEPATLLLDDVRDVAQSASILQLVGTGCHRMAEIDARLEKPAGALVRPMQRLLDLELLQRERPFQASERDSKRTLYQVADPFLRFWFRFVAPHRSWLAHGLVEETLERITSAWPGHVAESWEELARRSVPRLTIDGLRWGPAQRWWGPGTDRRSLEVDMVAESLDGAHLLLGSVKWEDRSQRQRLLAELQSQAERLPLTEGKRLHYALWLRWPGSSDFGPDEVLSSLR